MGRVKSLFKTTSNSRVYKLSKRRIDLKCSFCRPHSGCNKNRKPKRSWKDNSIRKSQAYRNRTV